MLPCGVVESGEVPELGQVFYKKSAELIHFSGILLVVTVLAVTVLAVTVPAAVISSIQMKAAEILVMMIFIITKKLSADSQL